VVDGNVERVVARLFQVEAAVPDAKPELKRLAGTLVTAERPGDWAQALMDLGATICRPKAPLCDRCAVAAFCAARASGSPEDYPRKAAKAERPRRHGTAFLLTCRGKVALVRRPDKGLLGGMLALPSGDWAAAPAAPHPPAEADWRPAGEIAHVFTHFSLTLRVLKGEAPHELDGFLWTDLDTARQALPTVFRKALMEGLGALL
jgi:A/G-specific adenine glycosylase